jgi:hypothetical protein
MNSDIHAMHNSVRVPWRSISQNSKFHAICRDFARSQRKWAGRLRDEHEWKVLLISGHTKATGGEAEVVAGLEGEFVNIRESSAQMLKARASSLIEYCLAAASHLNVTLTEYESLN